MDRLLHVSVLTQFPTALVFVVHSSVCRANTSFFHPLERRVGAAGCVGFLRQIVQSARATGQRKNSTICKTPLLSEQVAQWRRQVSQYDIVAVGSP